MSLSNDTFYFSHPLNFNDPFDFKINLSSSNNEEILNKLCTFLETGSGEDFFLFPDEIVKDILNKQYDYPLDVPFLSDTLEFLLGYELSEYKRVLNDMDIKKYPLLKVFLEFYVNLGVTCLCLDPSSPAMWAHYTHNHEGFCAEYEIDKELDDEFIFVKDDIEKQSSIELDRKMILSKVKYKPVRNNLLNDKSNKSDLIKEMFIKSAEWKYEDEYRLLHLEKNSKSYKHPFKLKRVCSGLRMNENDFSILKKVLDKREGVKLCTSRRSSFQIHWNNDDPRIFLA